MALKIRLRQQGKKNQQTYRMVVMDERSKRDGKYIEKLGWYNPTLEAENYSIDGERVHFWLVQGAEISDRAEELVKKGAPSVFKELVARREAKRLKEVHKRRNIKKKVSA